jgi:MFS family permease
MNEGRLENVEPESPYRPGLLERLFHIDLTRVDDRNTLFLCMEMFWVTMLSAGVNFNTAFAVRLGASNFHIGLLTSLPSLMAVLVSIPSGRILERKTNRKGWLFGSLILYRSGYLLLALVPFIKIPGLNPGLLAVMVLVLIGIPAHFFNVGWMSLLGEIVPEGRRAATFTARNVISLTGNSIFIFLYGMWLDRVKFPGNYQIMYLFGYILSFLSIYYLFRLDVPPLKVTAVPPPIRGISLWQRWVSFASDLRQHPAFMRIAVNTLLHGMGIWTASPLYVLYFVRDLGASDGWLGLQGTIASLATIAGFLFWRRQMRIWGESKTLKIAILGAGVLPLLVGLVSNLNFILVAVAINGLVAGGINLSHFNIFLKTCPEQRRTTYVALWITMMNIGACVGPLAGVALANHFGLAPVLTACGVVIILGSSSFLLWPVQVQPSGS